MYIVKVINDGIDKEILGKTEKLKSGTVQKGINAIDSFSFVMLPSNKGFNDIHDMKTLVTVYNTNKKRYEFYGRVLQSRDDMDESGLITKEVTCESFLGFLNDSQQTYVAEKNWTVMELLTHIINTHNSKVEEYKQFAIGEVTVTDPNDNLYLGIQRENSWKTLEDKLIKTLGGEIRFRRVDGVTYLDYLTKIGETKATPIKLSHNMKKISKEKDATSYITRLIPYGCKLKVEETTTDSQGNTTTEMVESEMRLDITSVNNGIPYVEDEEALNKFGIIEGIKEFDDVTEASNLLRKGREFLAENNKVLVKYAITTLDLSLLGLDIDDFDVHNSHPIENPLLGIDDVARIIKKSIDVVNDNAASSIEVGDNFKTLSDIQVEQGGKIDTITQTIGKIENSYATNEQLRNESRTSQTLINQTAEAILLSVQQLYAEKSSVEEFQQSISTELSVLAEGITAKFTTTEQQISTVDGSLQSKFNELYKYIKMNDDGITIGSGDSQITLQLDNEEGIVFHKNGIPLGRWDGVDFYTGNIVIEVLERAQFGDFAFVPRSDGSLMLLKIAGSTIVILRQPIGGWGYEGDLAEFDIQADGIDLTYMWQFSHDNGETWINGTDFEEEFGFSSNGATTNCFSFGTYWFAGDGRFSQRVRCIVTDGGGYSVISEEAEISFRSYGDEEF